MEPFASPDQTASLTLAEQLLAFRDGLTPAEQYLFDAIFRAAASDHDDVSGFGGHFEGTAVGRLARAIGLSAIALSIVLSVGASPALAAPGGTGPTISPATELARPAATQDKFEKQLLHGLNAYRHAHGLTALRACLKIRQPEPGDEDCGELR